ncbi:MAG: TIGR01212 family radical SAM protein [Spirochaetales bacterium]|nr:TIGR01212 family radical SAM protein [Spirochaetales bacterium]
MYLSYNEYLQEKYKARVYRIGVDAGFSCPNRKNGRNSKGCAFCDEFGARAVYIRNEEQQNLEIANELSKGNLENFPDSYTKHGIELQIKRGIEFSIKRYKAEKFILYFQAFSNTNAEPKILEEIYQHALNQHKFEEFIISTRPDCITEEIAQLLQRIKEQNKIELWVELGLQTADDSILEKINRGHNYSDFLDAFNLLRSHGIKIATHLIIGLPGEDDASFRRTIKSVAQLHPEGLKLHNLHIVKKTAFGRQYLRGGNIAAPSMDRYLDKVIYIVEQMPQETIIMRVTCDTPRDKLLAPARDTKKVAFVQQLKDQMQLRNSFQGKEFKN